MPVRDLGNKPANESNLRRPRVSSTRLKVLGTGVALPGSPVTTSELLARIEHNFGISTKRFGTRVAQRLGVHTRHICRNFTTRREAPRTEYRNPALASAALRNALHNAGIGANDLSYLLTHTATPARPLPSNVSEVARITGYHGPFAEFRQACTGFANALQFAAALLSSSDATPVAIVGSETGSVFFDPLRLQNDHAQWVNFLQMGDGAGAIILGPDDRDGLTIELPFIGQLESGNAGLYQSNGGSDAPWSDETVLGFEHDFEQVAARGPALLAAGRTALETQGQKLEAACKIIPHQANGRMSEWLAHHWALPASRCFGNGNVVGNLGSASIWVALDALIRTDGLPAGEHAWFLGAEATQYTYGGFILNNRTTLRHAVG